MNDHVLAIYIADDRVNDHLVITEPLFISPPPPAN